jgi:hypothetical protein
MSAFGGKADIAGRIVDDIGRRSLKGRAARKRLLAKKIVDTEGGFFLRFQNWARGCGVGLYAGFRIAGANFAFVFSTRW